MEIELRFVLDETQNRAGWSPTALRPLHLSTRFVGRNPPKHTLLRQGYGGYPPRIHPRVYTRGFLRRRVKRQYCIHWYSQHRSAKSRGVLIYRPRSSSFLPNSPILSNRPRRRLSAICPIFLKFSHHVKQFIKIRRLR